ncbi:hypothetical protein A2U01_0083419, partial [Trifolium medium]|nr:hypothetical protein [Trifolium medium]
HLNLRNAQLSETSIAEAIQSCAPRHAFLRNAQLPEAAPTFA